MVAHFCMWEWESFHGSCARGFSVTHTMGHSSCNFDGKRDRTQWSRYLWNLVLTSNFMCGTDLRRFPQRLMTCPFENIVALKRLSQFWFPRCSCMRQCLVFSSGYCYWSFSTCVFKCLFYMCAWIVALIHCLHLFDFSLCAFRCLLKLLASEDARSHWLHLFTFLHCAFSNVSSNCLPVRMQSHIDCICSTFPHCVFSNVSSNGLPDRM